MMVDALCGVRGSLLTRRSSGVEGRADSGSSSTEAGLLDSVVQRVFK